MPSLHFATSVMAAHVLRGAGRVQGALGWTLRADARATRSSTSASTTSSTCSPARADRGRRRAAPRVAPAGARRCRAASRRSRRGRTHEQRGPGRTAERRRPRSRRRRRGAAARSASRAAQALLFGLFVVSAVAFLYFVLPQIAGLDDTWDRIEHGDPCWLVAALRVPIGSSFGGYVVAVPHVFVRGGSRIDWRRELPDHDGRPGRDAAVRGGAARAASR